MTDLRAAPVTQQFPAGAAAVLPPGWWAPGLRLIERCALPGTPVPALDADGRAARRLARWQEQHQLGESGQFDRRLAAAGLSAAELTALLAEGPTSLAGRAEPPRWAELAEAVLARVPVDRQVQEPAGPEPVAWQAGFSVIVAPFAELAFERLASVVSVEGLDELVDTAELRTGFAGALVANLVSLASRTLVLELNVLRVTGRLVGETPQQRFWSFVAHFAHRQGLAALLAEYPVLARLLAQASQQAVESWLELLRRFRADRPRIVAEIFGTADPGRLVEVATGRGDTHQRGRSVALLRFDSDARLVYKPRPLSVHVHFNECLGWLNRIVPELGLRRLAVVGRGEYGWVEFAEYGPCRDRADVERYYRRQGALLALLYALDGADFHFENLIASGDQPVLVDMEALLHPGLPLAGPELLRGDPARPAYEASVYRVGLLPSMVFGEGGASLDMSGNGGDAGRPVPFKAASWAAAGTDEMRLVREQPSFPGSQNRPRLGEVEVEAGEFAAELVTGFQAGYDAISAHREDLTGPRGLLRSFATDELRLVARATRLYATLLYESTHPDVLRDALDRDRILDHLWALSKDDPARERLVEHEQRDLWAGDVPLFTARPDSRDAWTGDGVRLPGALESASLERAAGKVAALEPADREVQEWIIQAAFATRRPIVEVREPVRDPVSPPPLIVREPGEAVAVDPDRALAAARTIGDQLERSAYRERDRVGWLGLHFIGESQWSVQPLGFDLYGGYPGVALFLSQLAALTGEQRYAELARDALAPVRSLPDAFGERTSCSAFDSLPGIAYALANVSTNVDAPELLEPVEQLVEAVAPAVADDVVLDVIGGSAGGLVAMLAIHEATGLSAAWKVARGCADRLVETAKPQDRGVAWDSAIETTQPLTGFSHGASGIGWALLRFATVTGEQHYAGVGLDAFRYERSRYLPELGTWPDHRVLPGAPATDPAPAAMYTWCHGAPGIGLARADSGHTHLPEVAADLDRAVRGLLSAPANANFSLCHGELGNLELLTVAGCRDREALAAQALARFEQSGPVCGTPGGVATPGLMAGLAGIGHGWLRLGFPDRVPSILLLAPPRVRP